MSVDLIDMVSGLIFKNMQLDHLPISMSARKTIESDNLTTTLLTLWEDMV
jgi:hypothetical protein